MAMGVLWVDLSAGESQTVISDLRREARLRVVCQLRDVAVAIEQFRPTIICFEFKTPNSEELFALRECKRLFPSIPIIMLTEAHSEMLAVWALRARVWDYLVKPFSLHKIQLLLAELFQRISEPVSSSNRRPWFPLDNSEESRLRPGLVGAQRAVSEAKLYVQAHLAEKIVAAEVAEHCGLSQFHFSRLFKRETGITFSEYLIRVRVGKAMEALQYGTVSIGQVAADVGFLDPSYFAKIFKRYTDMSPKEYVEKHRQLAHAKSSPARRSEDFEPERRLALQLNR